MTDHLATAPSDKSQRLTLKDAVALSIVLATADVGVEDLMSAASCTRATATDYLRRADKVARVLLGRRSDALTGLHGHPQSDTGTGAVEPHA